MVRNFRFSMFALIVVTTLAACFLGAVSFFGRLAGLGGSEVALAVLDALVRQGPMLLVWGVGLVLLLQKSHVRPEVTRPAIIGVGGLIAISLIFVVFHVWLRGYLFRAGGSSLGFILLASSLTYSLLTVACWVFLLRALLAKIGSSEVALQSEDSP